MQAGGATCHLPTAVDLEVTYTVADHLDVRGCTPITWTTETRGTCKQRRRGRGYEGVVLAKEGDGSGHLKDGIQ